MMKRKRYHMMIVVEPYKSRPEERSLFQVEWITLFLSCQPLCFLQSSSLG